MFTFSFRQGADRSARGKALSALGNGLALLMLLSLVAPAQAASPEADLRQCRHLAAQVKKVSERPVKNPQRHHQAMQQMQAKYDQRCADQDHAAIAAFVALDPCGQLQQLWREEEQRLTASGRKRPAGHSGVVARDYLRQCPQQAEQDFAALKAAQQPELAGTPVKPVPAPGLPRKQTAGRFGDWLEPFFPACQEGNRAALVRCADAMIETAIREQRLWPQDVDACRIALPTGDDEKSSRQRRRLQTVEQDSWFFWSSSRCALKDKVAATFADPDDRVQAQLQQAHKERSCGINVVDPPQCDFAKALFVPDYQQWVRQFLAGCKQSQPICLSQAIEQAQQQELISQPAVRQCDTGSGERRFLQLHNCLIKRAEQDRASSSQYLSFRLRKPAAMPHGSDYRQSARLRALYQGDWGDLSATETQYQQTLFGQLALQCPGLGLQQQLGQLVNKELYATEDAWRRLAAGQASEQDLWRLLALGSEFGASLQNCDDEAPFSAAREQCENMQELRREQHRSPDAEADATTWLARHGCESPPTHQLAGQLSRWMFMSDANRVALHWLQGKPDASHWRQLVMQCSEHAPAGLALAWCSCYVRKLSEMPAHDAGLPAEHVKALQQQAFVGAPVHWFKPHDSQQCDHLYQQYSRQQELEYMRPYTTACLQKEKAAPERLKPHSKACYYQSARGDLLLYDTACRPALYGHQWGAEPQVCD